MAFDIHNVMRIIWILHHCMIAEYGARSRRSTRDNVLNALQQNPFTQRHSNEDAKIPLKLKEETCVRVLENKANKIRIVILANL